MKIEVEILTYTSYIEVDSVLYGYDDTGLSIVIDKSHDDSALELMPNTPNAIECTVPSYAGFKTDINDNWFVEIDSHYINAWKVRRLQVIDGSNTKLIFNSTQYLNVAETLANCITALNSVIDRAGGTPVTPDTPLSSVQFNDAGSFGGVSNVISNGTDLFRDSDSSPLVFDYDTRAGASDTNARLNMMQRNSPMNVCVYESREYYDNATLNSSGFFSIAAANMIYMAPFMVNKDLPIAELGVGVTTFVASSAVKMVIYESDGDGAPRSLRLTTNPIATTANGYFKDTVSFTFLRGVQYWIGVKSSHAGVGIRGIAASASPTMGLTFANSNVYFTHIAISNTYGSAAPNPSGYVKANRASGAIPSWRMRMT